MTTSSSSPVRKVCVVLVDRANYGRLKPVMQSIKDHPGLELQVVVAGTMVLERFHRPVDVVEADGFDVDAQVFMELEGSTPVTMAKSVGFGIVEFANEFLRLDPDIVLLIGDRYEALAAAVTAAYMNICLVHVQGGEVSGSIDESARHAISKFSQFHFPSTDRSAEYLIRMGERPETILGIGCPSSDIAKQLDRPVTIDMLNERGSGAVIDPAAPYFLVVFHPTTTEYGSGRDQMAQLVDALGRLSTPTILLWPNIDAGSDDISKYIRQFRDLERPDWVRMRTNFTPLDYLAVLGSAACAIGNSSSFVRDAGYFGTPVVLVGNRQDGREWDEHVTPVPTQTGAILSAVKNQVKHGRYSPSTLYGDGGVSDRIAEELVTLTPYTQKRLHFVDE